MKQSSPASIDAMNNNAVNSVLNNPAAARALSEKALILSKEIKYNRGIGQSFLNIGTTYWAQSYYSISLFYLNNSLIYLSKTDSLLLSDCYRRIGRDYADMMNYSQSFKFLMKAQLFASKRLYDKEAVISEYSYLYVKCKQYDKAIAYINRALLIAKMLNNNVERGMLFGRLANIYIQKKDFKKASVYCDTAYQLSLAINNFRLRASVLNFRALIYLNQNNTNQALISCLHSAALADSIGVMSFKVNAIKTLILIYEKIGELPHVLSYLNESNQLKDSLNRVEKEKSSELIDNYFNLNSKLLEIDQMQRRNDRQKTFIVILLASIAGLMIVLYVVYYYYRQKRFLVIRLNEQHTATVAQTQLIEAQAQHLKGLNKLKDSLLAVIGHDLRSPMNNLRTVTELFENGDITADEIHMLVERVKPAIVSAELTLATLLDWANSQMRDENIKSKCVDIGPVITELEKIFAEALKQKDIAFSFDLGLEKHALVDENHLKVVLRNLVSNAIKYTSANGKIAIWTQKNANQTVINVKDTRCGMTAEETASLLTFTTHFSKPGTMAEKGTGIGLLLCRELVELNGGKLWLNSEPGVGTTFSVSFPTC